MPTANRHDHLRRAAVRAEELESFLPLIESYQRFYEVTDIDRGRNRGFFGRLIAPSQFGVLLGAWRGSLPVGYACLHWSLNTLAVHETVEMHDLWVEPAERGAGIGRALIETAADLAHARGAQALIWTTTPEDLTTQRLYESLATSRDDCIRFKLKL